ncbi:ATP-binding cassette domain-containing protein [Streptomyces sp. NPDC048514]|uniref:ATP-binding cassette domain-containing protein n=1 Tax=Streptomyces sp. NPDC048514 TaxID=3365564 RepID=UPI0037196F07
MIQAFGLTSNPRKAHPPAIDDVSFEARAGHVTALLGGAGAGKTTALRLMLELQPGRGITYFKGRPLHRIAHPAREVGVLLGDVPGHPARSVRGHLRMLCAASGLPARRADEVLEVVGLVSLREERLDTLSCGVDRRLGLACALLPDPHTLVLDAPTDGLSAREAQWLHSMLRAHTRQGGTVLFTTADPKEAARTADRVVTLDGGRLVADQEAKEFARTRLRPRVAVRSPHAARLAALLAKEARTARRSVEVVREGGNRLSVYGSTTADVGETAFRNGILIHQLADEVGDMGPGAERGDGAEADGVRQARGESVVPHSPGASLEAATAEAGPAEREPARSGSSASGRRGAGIGSSVTGPGDAERFRPVEPGDADSALAAAGTGTAAALDASRPDPETPASAGASRGRRGAAPDVSPEERENCARSPSATERAASGISAAREDLLADRESWIRSGGAGWAGSGRPGRERAQAGGGERSSAGEDPARVLGPEQSESTCATTAQAARIAAGGGETVRDAVGLGAGATPAEAPTAAGLDRAADATTVPDTGQADDARPSKSPAGGRSSVAAGILATRTRLPGARNPGTGKPLTGRAVRPEGAVAPDALSPLPPPISVLPAPAPLRPLRYEIRRAAGVGTGFFTCAGALVVSAITAVVLARLGHTPHERLFAAWPRELPLPPAALAAGLLGALAFGDEFRHPALAADRGTVPRRLGLLTAKLFVSGATALLLAFLTVGCDAELLYLVYGRELTQVPADWLSLGAGWFALVVGCAWAGVLAAGVFRSTTAGLAAVLAVPVLVVPLVHQALRGSGMRMAAGVPMRMHELLLLQWPFGGERYLVAVLRLLAQPVGGAMVLSLTGLLCAYLSTTLRTRVR